MSLALPAFEVGDRELKILRALARYRFLSQSQLARIDGGSAQHLSRRLHLMALHGLVVEPATETARLRLVTMPRVFALAKAGADLLVAQDGVSPDRRALKKKNAKATTDLVAHTLDIAETMLAFELHAAHRGMPLIDYQDLFRHFPEATRTAPNPMAITLSKVSRNDVPRSAVPDRIFSLQDSATTRVNFVLEQDTGHMPVRRKKLTGTSSIAKKVFVYWNAWHTEEHVRRWGFQRFRVLFVTRAEARITTMIDRTLEITGKPSGLFLFTTLAQLANEGPFAPIWVNLRRAQVSLLASDLEAAG
ncbi:hypothetical protein HYPDE_26733 [Hyphomicrobium denitrificans 1NES1]|uniref:Uncharacterized protein n=1 Tax=Hyphomicrobium denitrificans 1NES1 TaxID=670307 RepID=N0B4A9_9HYPH|nr:replication-relaxation family protein [Hyphomicrobium denitrificans]AGK57027.1 hypothetical protein HYPDE_26733 [Hyphomicrobium denitrificans 1NES1]